MGELEPLGRVPAERIVLDPEFRSLVPSPTGAERGEGLSITLPRDPELLVEKLVERLGRDGAVRIAALLAELLETEE